MNIIIIIINILFVPQYKTKQHQMKHINLQSAVGLYRLIASAEKKYTYYRPES